MSDTILEVKVVPGASRAGVAGRYGDGLKVRVVAPPEKGRANDEVVSVLAAALGVEVGRVAIVAGHASPRKRVRVVGLSLAEIWAKLGV